MPRSVMEESIPKWKVPFHGDVGGRDSRGPDLSGVNVNISLRLRQKKTMGAIAAHDLPISIKGDLAVPPE